MLRLNYEVIASKIHLSLRGQTDSEGKFDWHEAILDAGIISGITFFTGLGTLASSAAISLTSFCVLLSAVGTEFLGILAAKRGLIQKNT
jgi:hypothetical protein